MVIMTHLLLTPITLPTLGGDSLSVRNRAFLAPMCQYSVTARDGVPTDWHLVHLGSFASGGFGLVTVEATAVEARGRISPEDLGLWDDEQVPAHRRIVDFLLSQGAAPAIQIAHAGGKASTWAGLPGLPSGSIPIDQGGWSTVGPTDRPVLADLAAPHGLSADELAEVVQHWADAARRADQAGYQVVQIHAAHGYLIHEFLSPLTNTRTDGYGGDLVGRSRLLREIVAAVRAVLPASTVLAIRFSGTDWVQDGLSIAEVAQLSRELVDECGVGWIDVSSGGLSAASSVPVGPGYQVRLAEHVHRTLVGTAAVTSAVGMITEAIQAESILASGQADAISIGRQALRQPHWAGLAASRLGVPVEHNPIADQYHRAFLSRG